MGKTEPEQALLIANMWLDFRMNPLTQMVPGDPDCDACVLARQYIRAVEKAERLSMALYRTQVGVNHIATYRTDKWPDYGTPCELALEMLGAGRDYDMWCCWSATMTARDELWGVPARSNDDRTSLSPARLEPESNPSDSFFDPIRQDKIT